MNGAAKNVFTHIAIALMRSPASSRTKRNPSTIDAQIFSSRAPAAGGGSLSVSNTAMTAKKLNALIASAAA